MIAQGLVHESSLTAEDDEIVYQQTTNSIALELGIDPGIVANWNCNKLDWMILTMQIRNNLAKSKMPKV